MESNVPVKMSYMKLACFKESSVLPGQLCCWKMESRSSPTFTASSRFVFPRAASARRSEMFLQPYAGSLLMTWPNRRCSEREAAVSLRVKYERHRQLPPVADLIVRPMAMKHISHFLFWAGVFISASGFLVGQADRIPFIHKCISAKYANALSGQRRLVSSGSLRVF